MNEILQLQEDLLQSLIELGFLGGSSGSSSSSRGGSSSGSSGSSSKKDALNLSSTLNSNSHRPKVVAAAITAGKY